MNSKKNNEGEDDLLALSSDDEDEKYGPGSLTKGQPVRRIAIIDACNVMHGCAGMSCFNQRVVGRESEIMRSENRAPPDAIGLFLMTSQLLKLGFEVYSFAPISYLKGLNEPPVKNLPVLQKMRDLGYVIPIEDGSHDDLVLLEMAKCTGGFVISNDKFRDHMNIAALKDVIQRRVVRFKFRPCPSDNIKKGRINSKYFFGLDLILKPPSFSSMYSVDDDDSSFAMVFTARTYRNQPDSAYKLKTMDAIADYVHQDVCQIYNVLPPPKLPYFDPQNDYWPKSIDMFLSYYYGWRDSSLNSSS